MIRTFLVCNALAATITASALAQTPIPPSSKDFLAEASQSDGYEIAAAQLAEVEGQDPRVRRFAAEMIQDHTRLHAALSQAAAEAGLAPPPPGMSSDQAALLAGLQGVRGAAFDRAYINQQVLAHTQAEVVTSSFAADGASLPLKRAAQQALAPIRRHLEMARALSTIQGSP